MSGLWDIYRRSFAVNRDRDAVAEVDHVYTYGELEGLVGGAYEILRGAGVEKGQRCVLVGANEVSTLAYDLAIMALGAVKIPLNSQLSAAEIGEICTLAQPTAIVFSDPGLLVSGLPEDCTVVCATIDALGGDLTGAVGYLDDTDLVRISFTGGTTGRPKGIMHAQQGMVMNLWSHLLESGIGRDDRLLLTTPLAHAAGSFALAALARGAFVRIDPRFDADEVLNAIDDDAVSWLFAVPTMIYRLLEAADRRHWSGRGSVRTIQYGAAPMSPGRLVAALDIFGPVFQQSYAQSECPMWGAVLRKDDHIRALEQPHLLSSCGKAAIMCDVAILDEAGGEVGAGELGEVALRAPYTMAGYWGDPDGYQRRFSGDWLRTGDIGRLDEDEYLYLVDRRNDMIVTGGHNVYSVEVENVLHLHPQIFQAAVIGIPDDDWGEAVHAVVVGSESLDIATLAAFCRDQLAAYKIPKSIELVPALPLTHYGKVDKVELRKARWQGRDRAVN